MRNVLDSWALMAWLLGEQPAARRVGALLGAAQIGSLDLIMSMMNLGEVFYLIAKRRDPAEAEAFLTEFAAMPIRTCVPTGHSIIEAARLKSRYRISYADAFAIQTAIEEKGRLVSGDPEIKAVADAGAVDLDWIG